MHIAYIHQHFATKRGATGTRSYEWSQRLIQAGHRVSMICGEYGAGDQVAKASQRISELEIDGIQVHRIAEPYSNKMSFARRLMSFGRFARAATKVVCRLDADLVFATSTPLSVGIPGMRGSRKLDVPFVFEVRDLWPELAIALGVLKNPLLVAYARRLERRIYRSAQHVIACAPGIKDGVCQTGYPADKVSVIPNASDLDLFQPSTEPLDDERFGESDAMRFVFTGAHGLANGLDAVLDAACELKRRGVSGVRFVFIGEGSLKDRLVARSKDDGLGEYVCWVPSMPKEELAKILPRMDVGMMILRNIPSFYYGTSPNKFFDYIACGLPVINNYPGWLAGMIDEHKIGRVVPPDDAGAFADCVVDLLERRDELSGMGTRARELAGAQFSRDKLGTLFVQTLEAVYASRTA